MVRNRFLLFAAILGSLLTALSAYGQTLSVSDLKTSGVSGFPQAKATVLVDSEDLRVSVVGDSAHIAVQAIVWKDDRDGIGKNSIGQATADHSTFVTIGSVVGDRKPKSDRTYIINTSPEYKGIHYVIYLGRLKYIETLPNGTKRAMEAESSSTLKSDTKAKGQIEYIKVGVNRRIRVDTLIIPLAELNKNPGDSLRGCYYVSSAVPRLKFNSCGYDPGKDYYDYNIPSNLFHKITLENTTINQLTDLMSAVSPYPVAWFAAIDDPNKPAWEILPQEAKAGEVILSKRNELGILSNFAATPFELDGKRYASVEGFWQMMLYPEGRDDERAKGNRVTWKYTREQVAQLTAFEAKLAGTLAEENMKTLGIDWVTYQGKKFTYRSQDSGKHHKLILAAMRAKLEQNPEVKRILLATGDLILKPDHLQETDAPPEWKYNEIWMQLRSELQKR